MAPTTVVSRENIESWAPDSPKLLLFRKAIAAMQAVSDAGVMDERGYQWLAGVHGGFGGMPFCRTATTTSSRGTGRTCSTSSSSSARRSRS